MTANNEIVNKVLNNVKENTGRISGVINGAGWEVLSKAEDFEALKQIRNEPKGTRHLPFQHYDAMRMFCDKIAESNLPVDQFSGMISPNSQKFIFMAHVKDEQIGDLEFNLGFLNTNDKSRSLQTLSGRTVFCCSNGMIKCDGEVEKRKHMKNVESGANDIFAHSVDVFNRYRDDQIKRIDRMKNIEVDDRMLADIILEMHRSPVFGRDSLFIGDIVKELVAPVPRHEEFKDRTLWSFENALTERYKTVNPIGQVKYADAFNGIIDRYIA